MKDILTRNEDVRSYREANREELLVRLVKPEKLPEDFNGTIIVDLPGPSVTVSGDFTSERPLNVLPEEVIGILEPGDKIALDEDVILLVDECEFEESVELSLDLGGEKIPIGAPVDINFEECLVPIHPGVVEDAQVHVLGKDIPVSGPTERDLEMIEFGKEVSAHAYLVSMVRSAEDVKRYKKHIPPEALVIAKVETNGAYRDLEGILGEADAAILARGDFALNVGFSKLPEALKRLSELGLRLGKPYLSGSGYLKSLASRPLPERAEIDSIAMAFERRVDAILLTKESSGLSHERFKGLVSYLSRELSKADIEVSSFDEALKASLEAKLSGKTGIRFVGDEYERAKARVLRGIL